VREKLGQFKHRPLRYLVLVLKLRADSVFDRQVFDLPEYHIVNIQQEASDHSLAIAQGD